MQKGSLKCPIRTLQLRVVAEGGRWPLERHELQRHLITMLIDDPTEMGGLIGVSSSANVEWLCVSAMTNTLSTGSLPVLEREAHWFEGLMKQVNGHGETGHGIPSGWQTSDGWVWLEVLKEAVSGTAGVLVSAASNATGLCRRVSHVK